MNADRSSISSSRHTRRPQNRARAARLTPAEALLLVLVILAIVLAAVLALRDPVRPQATHNVTIRVESSDTLWQIADRHTAPGCDIPATVELIKRVNGLSSSALAAGQTLVVPSTEEGADLARR
ncbi:MAG: LysM peptidoglycan-binding domain-containing protein [Coriobacteriia bacterium]|nr:LysM peptidoglycan-binding domain-containing protein [Coriobacteriia bacterium]